MDIRHDEDPLTDALLDQEIAKALAVEPSPEYVARVRAAIAGGPAPAGWHLPWLWIGVGSAAVAAAVIIGIRPPSVPDPRPESGQTRAAAAPTPAAFPEAPVRRVPEVPVERTARPAPGKAAASRPAAAAREPEVLIAREESAALRRLMQGLHDGELESTAPANDVGEVPADQPPSGSADASPGLKTPRYSDGPHKADVAAIVVTPMPAIPPVAIAPLELEEGEQQ